MEGRMKVRNTGSTAPLAGTSAAQADSAYRSAKTVAGGPAKAPQDVASIMGIPEAELTPKVRQAIQALMAEVYQLRQELDESKQRVGYLERLADQDSLAPVLNRRAFIRELTRMSAFAERYSAAASVLYFDVNGMKQINDSHGHAAGDAVLKRIAELLLRNTRASDVVGRLGGDEFGVILAQSDLEAARAKADSLGQAIAAEEVDWNGNSLSLSVAYGAHALSADQKVDEALEAADRAMYANKRSRARS